MKIPSTERRAWLASAGAAAFAHDWGGYASFLRKLTGPLEDLWPAEELMEIFCRHTQWLLANVSDSLDFLHGQFDAHWDDVTVVGEQHLRDAVAAGRGVMVLSAHQSHPGFGFFHPAWQELGY